MGPLQPGLTIPVCHLGQRVPMVIVTQGLTVDVPGGWQQIRMHLSHVCALAASLATAGYSVKCHVNNCVRDACAVPVHCLKRLRAIVLTGVQHRGTHPWPNAERTTGSAA